MKTKKSDIDVPNWLLDWVNIELPVLTVHGNHDNPIGEFSASAVDTLGRVSNYRASQEWPQSFGHPY